MFIVVLFVIAITKEESRWMKEMWYVKKMEYYSEEKMMKCLNSQANGMNWKI